MELLLCYLPLSFCYFPTLVPVSWSAPTARVSCMALLLNADADWRWPVYTANFSIAPSCSCVVVGLFPRAGGACVDVTGWMEIVQPAVAAYAMRIGVLDRVTSGSFSVPSATAAATATAVWYVLFVGHHLCQLGNLVRHGLDLRGHCIS